MIQVRGLHKSLPDAGVPHPVLAGVDLDVGVGESVAILGRSGSGKSTLLSVLALFDTPDRGSYAIDGQPTEQLRENARCTLRGRTFGFVFQRFFLMKHLTAMENVETALLSGPRTPRRAERRRLALEALDQVGLGGLAARHPAQLSGGEQQRVAIARAMVNEPKVLLADEPTGALDSAVGAEILQLLLQTTNRGTSLVMVTHDATYARLLDRTLRLENGALNAG